MTDASDMTEPKSSTIPMSRGGFIRPTTAERLAGRLMRAPDHSAADGDASDAGTDAGLGDADADATATAKAAEGDKDADADASLMSKATAEDGTGDGKGDGEKADTDGDGDKDKDTGVPEAYELKVTTKDAEGKDVDVEIDTELLTEATPVLKEVGLTNEQANKLAPLVLKVEERVAKRSADAFTALRADWAKQSKEDPELGGANWKETETHVARALDTFVGPRETKAEDGTVVPNEFRQLLDETGLGNHPVMIRAFRKIGEAIGEDSTFARGGIEADTPKAREDILYQEDK